jgi:hypothetical protein
MPGTLSLSDSGHTLYYETGTGDPPWPINQQSLTRLPVRPTDAGSGADPAVSPDGKNLALAYKGDTVTVSDLASKRIRRFALRSLIGPGASFYTTPAPLVWLSDTTIVAIPRQNESFAVAQRRLPRPKGRPHTCTSAYDHDEQCAIVIDLAAARASHLVILPGGVQAIDAAGSRAPDTLLLAVETGRDSTNVDDFAITADTATLQAAQRGPDRALPVGFSPDGHHLLYLIGQHPIQLWAGTITARRVVTSRKLISPAHLYEISW